MQVPVTDNSDTRLYLVLEHVETIYHPMFLSLYTNIFGQGYQLIRDMGRRSGHVCVVERIVIEAKGCNKINKM